MAAKLSPGVTARRRAIVLKHLAQAGGNITRAMQAAGLDRSVYYQWREQDPVFAHDADMARMAAVERVEQQLEKILTDGFIEETEGSNNTGAFESRTKRYAPAVILRFLERRHPAYKPVQRIEGEGFKIVAPAAGNLDISSLTNAERRELARLMKKCGADIEISES